MLDCGREQASLCSHVMWEKLGPWPKVEANVGLGELDRARNNVRGDFDPIKLCTLENQRWSQAGG